MLQYNEIKKIHLEITDKCNASCPMCIRNMHGGMLNKNLQFTELKLDDIKHMFPKDFLQQIQHFYMCGNTGDPIMASDTLDIFKYLREANPVMSLGMHTNASGRSYEWWYELGKIINIRNDYVRFSIDGLEDTNHIYRRNTNWLKIMDSATAFIEGGGTAIWEFIPFKHNQHQIEEARSIAKKMGFKGFQIIKTGRFIIDKDSNQEKLEWNNAHPVYNKNGELKYIIQPCDSDIYLSDVMKKAKETIDPDKLHHNFPLQNTFKSYNVRNRDKRDFPCLDIMLSKYDNPVDIECHAHASKNVYVSAEGYLLPCCWTGFQLYHQNNKDVSANQIKRFIYEYGLDNINLRKKSIKEVLEDGWFDKFISTLDNISVKDGCLMTCVTHCGKNSHVKNEYDIEMDDLVL